MSDLEQRLRARIERDGPITFYEWMKSALYDPVDGYYCRRGPSPQGRAGDYRTAPEISPLFGAAFARYFAKSFFDLGRPPSFTIFEAGAGAGDFAFNVLETLRRREPDMFAVTSYVLDEVSGPARTQSQNRLSQFSSRIKFASLTDIQEPFTGVVFSNEIIDAFPVHLVIGRQARLRELFVRTSKDDFDWLEGDPSPAVTEYCVRSKIQLSEGQIFEVNLDAETFITRAAAAITTQSLLITVDYGAERRNLLNDPNRSTGTLRAFRRHQLIENVLGHPGEQDLTSTIDWTQVREAGERAGLEVLRFERLDQFLLMEMGDILGEIVREPRDAAELARLTTSARELIRPDGLAASFQILVQRKM